MTTRKPARPSLPAGREAIVVPGLPAPAPAAAPTPPSVPPPAPYPGVQGYGRTRPTGRPRTNAKRADPPGMKRASYYITEAADAALTDAVKQVLQALGDDTPQHVALSALITAGAAQAAAVAQQLVDARATELAHRLEQLRQQP